MMRAYFWLLACALLSAGCSKKSPAPAGPPGGKGQKTQFPVEVAPIALRGVNYVVTAPGTLQAFEQVEVTARVGGAVDKVAFTEGQTVKAGQTLAIIEVDRYQVAVEQAQAAVAKAKASQDQAQGELDRRQGATAQNPGLIPGEEIATFQTQVQTAKADVAAAKEAQKVAELNLRDAYVKAPIAGIIQTRTVQTGQYLTPGTILATLLQRDPLLLKFQVTEQDAPRMKPGMLVTMAFRESPRTYNAAITLVAGSADPASHLVPITAQVDEKEHKYWLRPGAFCDVTVPVGGTRQAAVIPELSIRASEKGFLTYVVDGTIARERVVSLGMHTGSGFVEVTQGLSAGDLLVVRGAEPLTDGASVKVASRTTMEEFDAGLAPAASSSASDSPSASPPPSAGASSSGSPASSTASRTHAPPAPSQ